jgi:hypothetical protein
MRERAFSRFLIAWVCRQSRSLPGVGASFARAMPSSSVPLQLPSCLSPLGRLQRAVWIVCHSCWTWIHHARRLSSALAQACRVGRSDGPTPDSPLLQAVRRRGLRAVGSPLGWWVLVTLPDGRVAQITTLEAGQYRLALDGMPRQTFTSPDAALEMALHLTGICRR